MGHGNPSFPANAIVSIHRIRARSLSEIVHAAVERSRNAFEMTDTELRLIAAAATTGLRSHPKTG
jgi:hypothetical protein